MQGGEFVQFYSGAFHKDFSQASVYLDACFILGYLDTKHPYITRIDALIDKWIDCGVTVGISNHVFQEVVNTLLINEIHTVIELAYLKNSSNPIHQKIWEKQNEVEHDRMGDEGVAKQLLHLAGKERVQKRYQGYNVTINVKDLLKQAKSHISDREKLNRYYQNALHVYNAFLEGLADLGIAVRHLESDHLALDTAKAYMQLFQLEPADALHLALARVNEFDYLVTLDSDYVHNLYRKELTGPTQILKIGA